MGPVGTVETDSSVQSSGQTRLQFINQSMNQDRQEALVRFDPSLHRSFKVYFSRFVPC